MNNKQKRIKNKGITSGRPSNDEIILRRKMIADILNSEYPAISTIPALKKAMSEKVKTKNITLPSSKQTLVKDIEAVGFHCEGNNIVNDFVNSPATYHLIGILSEQIKKIDIVVIQNNYSEKAYFPQNKFDNSSTNETITKLEVRKFLMPMNKENIANLQEGFFTNENDSIYFLIVLKEHKNEQLIAELIYDSVKNYILYIETGICYIKIFFEDWDSMKKISDFISIISNEQG